MQKRDKDLLRTLVTELRHTLLGWYDDAGQLQRGDLDRELERLGIAPDGCITPLDALPNPTPAERRARAVAEAQLADLPQAERPAVRGEIFERAAYSWINRLLALRAMEARGLIEETLRPNSAYDGLSEALFILRHTAPQRATGADGGWWAVIEDACRAQAASLPGLFDWSDPNTALRPSTPALLKCLALAGGPLPVRSDDFSRPLLDLVFQDPDAIGWAYQFYQEEAKTRTYAKLGRGGKVETRAEIAAVTQLFTEPYMVQWLLQNSLGRSYHEIYPDSRLPETWAYYIRRSEDQAAGHPSLFTSLTDLTFMDPCAGSGHFTREAFDMLAAMYCEQHPEMDAHAIADRILGDHLHGIDIDPRAIQLAALTLYLRAWELVRNERHRLGLHGPGDYKPSRLNLATTPTHLDPGALTRHLQRHPEDRPFELLLRGVFEVLEQAPILGSLLKPGEHLDQAIRAFRKQTAGGQYGLLDEHGDLNRLLDELGRHDPESLKRLLLERIARSFATEAGDAGDVGAALFGREASEGLRLLQLLEGKYAVVATNPPYLGIANMDLRVKQFLEQNYRSSKTDLYSAFIVRCLHFSQDLGRTAMVTQQGWLFLKSFEDLRALSEKRLTEDKNKEFAGVLRETTFEAIAHLGANAFSEIGGEVVQSAMFILEKRRPTPTHRMVAVRLVGLSSMTEKQLALVKQGTYFSASTSNLLKIPGSSILYWLTDDVLELFSVETNLKISQALFAAHGLGTRNDPWFVRFWWENNPRTLQNRWFSYSKGGRYAKWSGTDVYDAEYAWQGARIGSYLDKRYPYLNGNFGMLIADQAHYFRQGFCYSEVARGSLGVRVLSYQSIPGHRGPGLYPVGEFSIGCATQLNSRLFTYLYRALCPSSLILDYSYFRLLPYRQVSAAEEQLGVLAYNTKALLTECDVIERKFNPARSAQTHRLHICVPAILHTVEGVIEDIVIDHYAISEKSVDLIVAETGVPSGWHPLIAEYDQVPDLYLDIDLVPLPQEVLDYVSAHQRISPDPAELARIKANLRTLYEAGPGAKTEDADLEEMEHQGDEDEAVSGAYIPIPTETFLEELSVKLQIHPISVYWLLEELRAEEVRCKPEERRLLEDRLSVLVLRLLGHRWPRQLEAGEPVPPWADRDGIIPLTPGAGEPTVAERLREQLRSEDGPLGAQRAEALLEELTGQSLETWLRKTFYDRHTKQFKRRPVAWHLLSTPVAPGKKKSPPAPAFECLLYYHACGGDVLARIRTQYVEPLVFHARRTVDAARRSGDETAAALATARIHELEDFAGRLRQVEETGFACAALDALLAEEPLDRWSGDGVFAPVNRDELLSNERAWRVDINDGVRVNVAPLQKAGLLAGDVLNKKHLDKAIADRARWRSDERRWVRAGKLPRCGWMDESVPESPAWTDLAPAREAERVRLEEKRKTALDHTSAANNSQ